MKRTSGAFKRLIPNIVILVCILLLMAMTLFPLLLLIFNSFKMYTDDPLQWPSPDNGNMFTTEGYSLVWGK